MKVKTIAVLLIAALSAVAFTGCTDSSELKANAQEDSRNSCCRSEKSECCKDKEESSDESSHIPDCCGE